MKYLIVLTTFLGFSSTLLAQGNLRLEDDRFIVLVTLDSLADESGYYSYNPHTLEIHHKGVKRPVQTIKPELLERIEAYRMDNAVQFEDVNFDGYHDIMIKDAANAYGYNYYAYWIYNPTQHKFVADTALDNYCNLTFNADNKSIHTFWRVGLTEFGHSLYQWKNGKVVLVAEEISYASPEDVWTTIIRWNENGILKEKNPEEEDPNFEHYGIHYDAERLYKYL